MLGGLSKKSSSGSVNIGDIEMDGVSKNQGPRKLEKHIFLLNSNMEGHFRYICFHHIPILTPKYPKLGSKLKKEMFVLSMSFFNRLMRGSFN